MDITPGRGQPTKYLARFCEDIVTYFARKPYTVIGKGLKQRREIEDFPSFSGFAVSIGVHRGTLLDWCDAHPEFKEAYQLAKDHQYNFFCVNAARGLIHPSALKILAAMFLDFRDDKGLAPPPAAPQATHITIDVTDRVRQLKGES